MNRTKMIIIKELNHSLNNNNRDKDSVPFPFFLPHIHTDGFISGSVFFDILHFFGGELISSALAFQIL